MPFGSKEDQKYFTMAYKFSKKYGIPCVVTNDVHYLKEIDWEFHEALLAIGTKKRYKDKDRWKFGEAYRGQLFLKSPKRMKVDCINNLCFMSGSDIDWSFRNANAIAEMCKGFDLPKMEVELPTVIEGVRDTDECLRHMCKIRLKPYLTSSCPTLLTNSIQKEYSDRLDFELERIITLGFTDMLLMVADYVHWAKENDILVGQGRGSVGGSLVAFLLGITGIDPVRFNLLFDRFISDGRIDLPDIDMDFEDKERYRIDEYLRSKYGQNNCAFVSTFLTYRGRQSIRDASRYMDVSYLEADKVAKSIIKRSGGDMRSEFTCKDSFEVFEEAKEFAVKHPEATQYALQLEGRAKTVGVHAAGIVVSKDDLSLGNRCVLIKRKGKITINWDKSDMEHMGLLKLDILGLSTLSVLKDVQKLVKQREDIDIDYYAIDPEGPESEEIYREIFNTGNTVGIFQFTTKGLQKMCRDVGVKQFSDIVAINALYRPGALRSGMANNYIARKNGTEEIPSVCKVYDDLTKDTYGIILYQEQIMQLIYNLARMPWKTVDTIRKVISKSQGAEAFLKWKGDFVEGCRKYKTLDPVIAERLYDKLKDAGSYSFNCSHSLGYAWMAYWTAYMKLYHPVEYMCSLFNHINDEEKLNIYMREAISMGIKVKPPDVRFSGLVWAIDDKNDIVAPITSIKGIGDSIANRFEKVREEALAQKDIFSMMEEFAKLGRTFVTRSIRVGAFDWIGSTHDLNEYATEYSKRLGPQSYRLLYFDDRRTMYECESGCGFTREEREKYMEKFMKYEVFTKGNAKVRSIRKRIGYCLDIVEIQDFMSRKDSYDPFYLYGKIEEIKFSYKESVINWKGGGKDSLGGVYGAIGDGTDSCMIIFNPELYQEKKKEIESLAGQTVLARCFYNRKIHGVTTDDITTVDELASGEMELELRRPAKHDEKKDWILKNHNAVQSCNSCSIHVKNKLHMSFGRDNIMVVTDQPITGYLSGILFNKLRDNGVNIEHISFNSLIKCPTKRKLDACKENIKVCQHWLKEEVIFVRPYVILALGKYVKEFFNKDKISITKMYGCIEWSVDYLSWIVYGPAIGSTYYSDDNKKIFNDSVDVFCDVMEHLG